METEPEERRHSTKLWTPFWTRRRVFLAFSVLFTAMWLSMILVWQLAVKQKDLALRLSTNHYAWTYGPTAIFVVVVGLWRQTDYFCKTTQAWQDMSKGLTPAHRSMLLDYMWPLLPTTIGVAFRNRHFAVVTSTFAFLVLKIITVVSTTLLVSLPTPITRPFAIEWNNAFSDATVWPSLLSTYLSYGEVDPTHAPVIQYDHLPAYGNLTSTPVFSYLGVLNGQGSNEIGVQDSLAFSTFDNPDSDTTTTSIAAMADVFEPQIVCEEAQVTPRATVSGANPVILELTSETCSVGHMNLVNAAGDLVNQTFIYFQSLCLDDNSLNCQWEPDVSLYYRLQRVNCNDKGTRTGGITASDPSPVPLTPNTTTDYRLLLMTATRSKRAVSSRDLTANLSAQVDSAALICRIGYDISLRAIRKDMSTQRYELEVARYGRRRKLGKLTDLSFAELVFGTLYESFDIFGEDPAKQQVQYIASYPTFKLMGKAIGDEGSFEQFLNATTMRIAAKRVFGGIAAHIAQQKLSVPGTIPGTGIATFEEHRLHVRIAALWIMVSAFILLTGCSILVMLTILRDVLPGDPSFIGTHCDILASSGSMQRLLRDCGSSRSSQIRAKLRHKSFQTFFGSDF